MSENIMVVVAGVEIWVDEKTESIRFKCNKLVFAIPYESWPIIDRLVEQGFHRANHEKMKNQIEDMLGKITGGNKPPDWSK